MTSRTSASSDAFGSRPDPENFSLVLGGTATAPFLMDVECHAKFLLAMPLLIAAELVVHQRMRSVVKLFVERQWYATPSADGSKLSLAGQLAIMVVFLLCVILGPLLMVAAQLAAAKRTGLREHGTLAEHYVRQFDAKWLRGGAPDDEPFVGSADIQSLADLANSFEVVRTMRIAPFTKEAILQIAAATLTRSCRWG